MHLVLGDCRESLKELPTDSVDSVVTDPPYELGFMGKSWDSTGIAYNIDMWAEVFRVLKPGGHLLSFGGSRTYHRMACAIEDAGFEIRDQIMWVYGSGFPKSLNIAKAIQKAEGVAAKWDGWGTALKPAHEPIVLARKPLIGTVANNVLTYGTGGLNIDASRVGIAPGDEPSADHRTATFGNQDTQSGGDGSGGWTASSGRWPANVIHDGSDEVVALFPDNVKGGTWNRTDGARHFNNDGEETNYISSGSDNTIGSAARFFYCAKANKRDKNEGLDGFEAKNNGKMMRNANNTSEEPSVGFERFATEPSANHHPTVKPTDLMRYLCRLITPPNGTVLDPFMGSGSTGKACVLEGFDFIGMEQSEEYLKIAKARIEFAKSEESREEGL